MGEKIGKLKTSSCCVYGNSLAPMFVFNFPIFPTRSKTGLLVQFSVLVLTDVAYFLGGGRKISYLPQHTSKWRQIKPNTSKH